MLRWLFSIWMLTAAGFPFIVHAEGENRVAGTYKFVAETRDVNGVVTEIAGNDGRLVLDADGNYVFTTIKIDLPKVASGNRTTATPDETRQIVAGSLAHFGRYKVVENVLVFDVERATFANWNGIEQKRAFTLTGDELRYVLPVASGGGSVTLTWRRIR
jgi:hypothetical protein